MLGAPPFYDAPNATYRLGTGVVDTLPEAVGLGAAGVPLTLSAFHLLNALARVGGLLTAALLAADRRDPPDDRSDA